MPYGWRRIRAWDLLQDGMSLSARKRTRHTCPSPHMTSYTFAVALSNTAILHSSMLLTEPAAEREWLHEANPLPQRQNQVPQ